MTFAAALCEDRGVRRPRGEDGAAAVEFAIVAVLLLTLLFGIIEFSLVMRDKIAVTSAARAGGAAAAALPRMVGAYDPATGTPASVAAAVPAAVLAVQSSLGAMGTASIGQLWVYQSGPDGTPANGNVLPSGGGSGVCVQDCVRYVYDPDRVWTDPSTGASVTGGFAMAGGSWPATAIDACAGDPRLQSVGVYVQVEHKFILGSLVSGSSSLDVSDRAAFRFTPIPTVPGPCS